MEIAMAGKKNFRHIDILKIAKSATHYLNAALASALLCASMYARDADYGFITRSPGALSSNPTKIYPSMTFHHEYSDKHSINESIKDSIRNAQHISVEKSDLSLEDKLAAYAELDNFQFKDNDFYSALRYENAAKRLSSQDLHAGERILVVDKTFQKMGLYLVRRHSQIISVSELSSNSSKLSGNLNDIDIQDIIEIDNDKDHVLVTKLSADRVDEIDISTAKNYGVRKKIGDNKTPEGFFSINSIERAQDMLFQGKEAAYGSYIITLNGRLTNSIYIHGNGTDSSSIYWNTDKSVMPEPLGIGPDNNFGYGESHGCTRTDTYNGTRKFIDKGKLLSDKEKQIANFANAGLRSALAKVYMTKKGNHDCKQATELFMDYKTKVLIFEDKALTLALNDKYNSKDHEKCARHLAIYDSDRHDKLASVKYNEHQKNASVHKIVSGEDHEFSR